MWKMVLKRHTGGPGRQRNHTAPAAQTVSSPMIAILEKGVRFFM
jgi:hypothetical protein